MTRGIVIAGNESGLSRAIEAEAAKRVTHYAAALIPNRFSEQGSKAAGVFAPRPEEAARLPLEWNPSSPISARTVVLAAENRLEHIDEAILICCPPAVRRAAAELPLADIEVMINDHFRGWFFLVRELAALFRARQSGTLALVYAGGAIRGGSAVRAAVRSAVYDGAESADLLGPSALASFEAFTHSLLVSAFNEPYLTMGFSCAETGSEAAFASFTLKLIEEGNRRNNGKLHKYGKFSFLK
jgi:NAD(P)-dependent dehydrogenase (short-subunit alcohol dehydrogenase family)